ncbi:hypothetical protein H4W80_000720 [Nonomuraea angiospora]|uniref:Uncharacterized protein n=1 Tax=Nonomuraea angiospora TaxID=46172 RepID=A0ABR9LQA2_9ACTN|nr:hypothetical protein [Nonomuraea angiospora]
MIHSLPLPGALSATLLLVAVTAAPAAAPGRSATTT